MKNYFDIKDKVAVITGASSGLGWQIAQAYASQGAKLALFCLVLMLFCSFLILIFIQL